MTKKIKILTISDHPLSPSGVGTQTRYVIESLLKTGRFEVISLGGAISHNDYTPVIVEGWEDNWKIFPVDAYGDQNLIRSVLRQHRPDILYFMTDPRFYDWLWQMEDEIRESVPMVYYHVWDNYPYPTYNKVWYDSTDVVATISKVTSDIVQTVSPSVEEHYIPHAVNSEIFKKLDDPVSLQHMKDMRKQIGAEDKVIFFWNNRNARRKQSGSLIFWFKKFLDKVGHDKACLMMHTDINDPHGQPLHVVAEHLGLSEGQIVFSTQKVSPQHLSLMYNASDVTVNISDAEGFGLGTLESLSCQTPIVVTMTGGLQEQVTDGENYFGVGIEPSSKAIIGSLNVPWIYEDRLSEEVVVNALLEMYHKSPEERKALGLAGRQHVMKNYNFQNYGKKWDELLTTVHEEEGSWATRKSYQRWECKEVA